MKFSPAPQGLYHPSEEHDSCGVAMIVNIRGARTHALVAKAITALVNLDHRGAAGAEPNTGDGAGALIQIPDRFLREVVEFELPQTYGTGIAFLPQSGTEADNAISAVEGIVASEGLSTVGWREVPVDDSSLGALARDAMPTFRQIFVEDPQGNLTGVELERRLYVIRKRIEHELRFGKERVYFPSLSSRTMVYKGMLTTLQLQEFYPDLRDQRVESAVCIVHARFSTNTFPSWPLAHPYRYLAHNGEINTVAGNSNWMRARESLIRGNMFGGAEAWEKIFPIVTPGASDTARFDEVVELLTLSGRSLAHVMLMMVPEAWENNPDMPEAHRNFYRYHASLMEPWDGPASLCFTDGTMVGALLDRNGLRPGRVWVTDEEVMVASEVGAFQVAQEEIIEKTRLQPGRMLLVDTRAGRIIKDDEVKDHLSAAQPYGEWLTEQITLNDLPVRDKLVMNHERVVNRQHIFGYTTEDINILLKPMAVTGQESIGSMGTDTPIAALSRRSRLLFDYFQQLFAQVTNPPLDAIREEIVTSMYGSLGPERDLLNPERLSCRQVQLDQPILTTDDLARLVAANDDGKYPWLRSTVIPGLYPVAKGGEGLAAALDVIRSQASDAIAGGARLIVLSDRNSNESLAPIPSLLLTAAVHHHLIREKTRTKIGLIVEAGDAREIHHLATLLGCGAAAVNPYLALETLHDLVERKVIQGLTYSKAEANYVKAASKGVLKIMSKMGISTLASYTGAQLFQIIGLDQKIVDEYFTGLRSQLGGVGLEEIAHDVATRHHRAFIERPEERAHRELTVGGEYQWRREGEYHLFNPETVFKLQHSTRTGRYELFKEYTKMVDERSSTIGTLRGLFEFDSRGNTPIPVDEVEPISEILKRFSTGAMSYGSISAEAHETLAIAMNRIGGRSNSGEGGEDADRFTPEQNGDLRRSAIKQVASGRFGVTSHYLVNCTDIQIKMAQGAKPGEGGQLPGHKMYPWIAKTRHSTPGVGLISPPPHHDIYSIEDLAQLIYDLKNANPLARIHVKLVSEIGVGTVAAGVSKCHADVVLISGHDGGTGASPLNSLKHAGAPWEIGLAETQQTLLLNGLRDRIVVQVDGQMKTGRDVMVAALLGAEEFGFATAPLVVEGCVMMRVCHLDTCPVGVATQNPVLRARFDAKPEFVVNFFEFIAQEVRELLASLGLRSVQEAVGQSQHLNTSRALAHWSGDKAGKLDLSPILHQPEQPFMNQAPYCTNRQEHGLEKALDQTLIAQCNDALEQKIPVILESSIANLNRSVGTMLGSEVTKAHGAEGLAEHTITVIFDGIAGNSFAAFLPQGITLRLNGEANDYVGKGLSGGNVTIRPPKGSSQRLVAEDNIIAGNVVLFGATSGKAYIRGKVGERFAVRNSGATAVVEGIGDHGCEYMTGGRVVILGAVGRNFAAGMSGGIAYVYNPDESFESKVNREFVDLEDVDVHDQLWLHTILTQHVEETGSAVARRALDMWEYERRNFVKVMPRDYKRVLITIDRALAEGRDPDKEIMESVHA